MILFERYFIFLGILNYGHTYPHEKSKYILINLQGKINYGVKESDETLRAKMPKTDVELTEEVESNVKVKSNPIDFQKVGNSVQLSSGSRTTFTSPQGRTFQGTLCLQRDRTR